MWLFRSWTPDLLRAIGAPTLVMAGDRDLVSLDHTVALFEAIPGASLCIVPGGGHGLLAEQPALTSLAVTRFLDGPDGPDGPGRAATGSL